MKKVLCFGELLLRLPPANAGEWLRMNQLPVFIGGAELNVATALSVWNIPVKYCTALPDNIIAKDIVAYLEQKKIDTSPIIYAGERIGLYYLQQGADMKSAANVFDRKYSSFSTLATGIVDWDTILQDVDWFHFSAIAPAVSESAAALCLEAVQEAAKRKIRISLDLNHRSSLWQYGKSPIEIMPELARYCHLIMGNIWSAQSLLGVPLDEATISHRTKEELTEQASRTAAYLFSHFPSCQWVANTFRFDGTEGAIEYYATLNNSEGQSGSPLFTTKTVVDKVGSGDCFMAGLIYGMVSGKTPQEIISFAAGAAFGKLQEKGDATQNSVASIQQIVQQFQQ